MTPQPAHGETSYQGHGRLAACKALVTGGGSGIGRAAANAFAREGADDAFGYLPSEEEDPRAVVAVIESRGRKALPLPGDITHEAFCLDFVARAVEGLGARHPGQQRRRGVQPAEPARHHHRAVRPHPEHQPLRVLLDHQDGDPPHAARRLHHQYGLGAGLQSLQGILDYALIKAGIVDFTKELAKQVIERGLRVNAVAPGPFWTPLQPSGGQPIEKLRDFGRQMLLGRPGQPVELASV